MKIFCQLQSNFRLVPDEYGVWNHTSASVLIYADAWQLYIGGIHVALIFVWFCALWWTSLKLCEIFWGDSASVWRFWGWYQITVLLSFVLILMIWVQNHCGSIVVGFSIWICFLKLACSWWNVMDVRGFVGYRVCKKLLESCGLFLIFIFQFNLPDVFSLLKLCEPIPFLYGLIVILFSCSCSFLELWSLFITMVVLLWTIFNP